MPSPTFLPAFRTLALRSLTAAGLLLSFAAYAADADTILLRGSNGITVTAAEVKTALDRMPDETRINTLHAPALVQQMVNNIYLRRAAALAAEQQGLDKNADVAAKLQLVRENTLGQAWVDDLVAKVKLAPQALEAYAKGTYKGEPQRFERAAQYQARYILIGDKSPEGRQRAEALLAQLKQGASFEDLARKNSQDLGSAAKGGALGWLAFGVMGKALDETVAKLKPGALSEVVESEMGYHIVLLEDYQPAKLRPYEEVRDDLHAEALGKLQKEARDVALEKLQAQAKGDVAALEAFIAEQKAKGQ